MHRVVLLLLLVATGATAHADVGLVVYAGPAAPGAAAKAARDRAATHARDAHVALVDASPAPPAPPVAADRLRAGIDAYEELRWDDALAALDDAAADAWRTGADGLSTSDLSDIFLYRGLAQTQHGDATLAWDDLVRAATIAPTRTLDPLRFPSRAVEAFERARASVAQLARAKLTIDAAGCDVAIDGGAGSSADVPVGEHAVRATCSGAPSWGERVVVSADTSVTPPPPPPPPDDAALVAIAKSHGASAVLAVIVSEAGAATAAVLVIGVDGHVTSRASIALADDAAALEPALAAALAPPPPSRRKHWWQSRWVWAAAGVAVTAAVLGPFVADESDTTNTATVTPIGWHW